MRAIKVSVLLADGAGKPRADVSLTLEMAELSDQLWKPIRRSKTNARGQFSLAIKPETLGNPQQPPLLRLCDAQKRVLAQGGQLSYDARSQTLEIDFGQLEYLEKAAFPIMLMRGTEAAAPLAAVPLRREGGIADLLSGNAAVEASATRAQLNDLRGKLSISESARNDLQRSTKVLEAQITTLTQERDAARAAAEASRAATPQVLPRKVGTPAKVDDVFKQFNSSMVEADKSLQGSRFRIGKVKLDLRGSLLADGKIELGGEHQIDPGGLSVELNTDETTPDAAQPRVPDLSGLTRGAALRVLQALGLRLRASTHAGSGGTPGQMVMQTPAAGEQVILGSEVLVVFAAVE
ncbi:PASTA domain-containing protein [Rhodobacter aestuarii]|uniref:PASTA domain-containing protein n=1 Tax=Rhodobacter aestuarii TaxID=453582 RepID=A0A1N7L0Q8_9RHOB|nr:PASTA domain-containing protein [Rhodobacter aestuarii]PTV95456.1 PASTA domain-containing protein [Rhodobacter aestuarii]SIS67443.1 PASTA domain-containing protein [Rhodobacter aestuarii]